MTYPLPIQKFLGKSFTALVFALVITLPISIKLSNLTEILLSVVWLLLFIEEKFVPSIKGIAKYILLISLFLFLVLGIFISDDLRSSAYIIEKSLPLLAFPTILYFINPKRLPARKYVLMSFVGINLLLTLYCYLSVFLTVNISHEALPQVTDALYRDNLISFLSIHPIYFALYLAFSLVILLDLVIRNYSRYSKYKSIGYIFIMLHFLIFINFLAARMAIVSLVIAVIFYFGYYFALHTSIRKAVVGVCTIISLLALIVIYIPGISKRYYEVIETPWDPPIGLAHNSTNLRIAQWKCSIEVIKDNLLWGTGTGDGQAALNSCYQSKGWSEVLYELNYNSHNQYLQTGLQNGIFALACLIGILFFSFYVSIKNNDMIFSLFIVIISISFLTESYLLNQKGVIFFSFFTAFFMRTSHSAACQQKNKVNC